MTEKDTALELPATAAPKEIEVPLTSFVRGGSTTMAWDRHMAQQKLEAQKRRKIEDKRSEIAQANPLEAHQYTKKLGGTKDFAAIMLEVRHPKDNVVLDYIECELNAADDGSLILIMACYRCFQRGVSDNFTIRQTHRHFELDTRRQGELWVNPKNPQHVVTIAGTITLNEKVTCPNLGCGLRFTIDNSVVREV